MEELTQKQQMIRYGIKFGKEVLEKLRNEIPTSNKSGLEKDCRILETQIRLAERLLEEDGEFDPVTVSVMRGLVHRNSYLCETYLEKR